MRKIAHSTVLCCLIAVAGISPCGSRGLETQIVFPNVGSGGIFDPSVADAKPEKRAWMSYSAVNPSPAWPAKNVRTVSTRLAYSDDRGATWSDAGKAINEIKDVRTGSQSSTWINEVSSLVFDPAAPPEQRWRLFWHHYLQVNGQARHKDGWIGCKSAAAPQELSSAKEIKLVGGRAYDAVSDDPLGDLRSPAAGPPLVEAWKLHPDLSRCVAFTEPGALATPAGLFLALNCMEPALSLSGISGVSKLVLLKCGGRCRPDAPGAWHYVGTMLSAGDAKAAGFSQFSASDLFQQGGRTYLIATPVTNKPWKGAYNGCQVFRFADLETARLERSGGRPLVVDEIKGVPGSFNGACTYSPSAASAGYLYSQLKLSDKKPFFEIFKTGRAPRAP